MAAIIDRSESHFWQRTGVVLDGPESERLENATLLVDAYLRETDANAGYPWDAKPEQFEGGKALLGASPDLQAAFVVAAVARMVTTTDRPHDVPKIYEIRALLPALLRRRPPLRESDAHAIIDMLAVSPVTWSSWVPVLTLAKAIERWNAGQPLSAGTRRRLERLCASADGHYFHADERKGLELLKSLLTGGTEERDLIDAADDWGVAAIQAMRGLDPAVAAAWQSVLEYAASSDASKPSAKWLKNAKAQVMNAGEERFAKTVADWLLLMKRPASGNTRIGTDGHLVPASLITDRNGSLLKGLAWMCSLVDDGSIASVLGDTAIACFTKIPEIGARCVKAGNGCIHALGAMQGMEGVAQLVRLQQRINYSQARRLIDNALDAAAMRSGLTRDDLTDLAVLSFGLEDGRIRQTFGTFTAEIAIGPDGRAPIAWFDSDGKPRKSEPADVKRAHAEEIKALKRNAGDIEAMLGAQRLRIERFLMADREWSFPDWRARLLDHPLLSFFARRLIWSFTSGGTVAPGSWLDGRLVGSDDVPLTGLGAATRVHLFHPVQVDAETTRSWQVWLERHQVTQPFKQAHREVYRLTDAEREAQFHSARFAGHILHQHQFAALCKQRGWTYRLQSAFFDGANIPTLALPVDGLQAEFLVDVVEDDGSHTQAGISRYVATEHVSFSRAEGRFPRPLRLAEIEPAVFSEVMRDVDLFVGVCSIGADPAWQGRDGEQYGAYWLDVSFGDLTRPANGRRELLERLLPALAIAPRCSLADRFLVVRGDLRTYKIHLGSGNVQMEPNNEYLCIVQKHWGDGERATERIYLPFEGDSVLSLILSKAFLLANDTGIKDPTITRQIQR